MAGIYVHIPFCRKACHYCNFHFSTSLALRDEFIHALLKEVELMAPGLPGDAEQVRNGYLGPVSIETIYFGGGTPSLLSHTELNAILQKISARFIIEPGAEITLEANPDDIDAWKLKEWKAAGINRLSIGVQSFFNEDLKWMNRAHDASQAIASILLAQQAGYNNITIDLIYGTPLLTNDRWEHNVTQAIKLGIPHLSCYALTVEPSTVLEKMIRQKKSQGVDPDRQAEQFLLLTDWMESGGYEHYEISNFARPGMRSRHNSSYWQGKHYLGLGPSAHSFNGTSRQWNIANNALYIQSLQKNILPSETEILTPDQKFNEYVMTSLRTAEGMNADHVASEFGQSAVHHLHNNVKKYISDGKVKKSGGCIFQLTKEGKLYADGIAADLFR